MIKGDTIYLVAARGSQSADIVRRTVKTVLEKYGHDDTYIVNIKTNGDATMIAARHPFVFPTVGL